MRSVTTVGSFRTLLSPRMAFLFFIIQRNRGEEKVQRAALVCAHTVASTRNDLPRPFCKRKIAGGSRRLCEALPCWFSTRDAQWLFTAQGNSRTEESAIVQVQDG